VASKYHTLWSARPPSDLMNEYRIQISYADGCKELRPEFKLFEPASIIIKILDCHWPFKGSVAASLDHSVQDFMNPLLAIFLKELELTDSTVIWKGFSLSFECIVNHELLHACGDSPRLRHEVHDGIIRHNMICSEAINNLTKKL
jgi:hypothetical protein